MFWKRSSFRHQLVVFYMLLFVSFGGCVFVFQQYRERTLRREALISILSAYTQVIEQNGDAAKGLPHNLRITVIDRSGRVVYDNEVSDTRRLDNHLSRPEITEVIRSGQGTAIRHSETKNEAYFYYATRWGDKFLRVALPNDSQLQSRLSNDTVFLLFFGLLFVVALGFILYFSNRFGGSIKKLHQFILATEQGRDIELLFPDNELGEISNQIVRNYRLLKKSEKRLSEEHRKLQESVALSQKLKHDMTGNIAHELKTPVAAIRGYIETLLSQRVSPSQQQHFLERCNDQIIRLSNLLNDIALITKIEEAPSLFPKERVNLHDVLCEVLSDLDEQIAAVCDTVQNTLPRNIGIDGNRMLIYSVFRNLTENTLSYAGSNVTISIRLIERSATHYVISYADNGIGVAPEHFARLFERFYRADYGRTRNNAGGSGLGLSIVRNALVIHNGTITVQESEGGGLEFLFTLPIS